MRKRSLLAMTAGLTVLLAACATGGEDGPERSFLSLGTAPQGGAFFPVGGAIAEVLNEYGRAEGWQVTAEATKGSQENIRRLIRGELDLALANSAITYFAVRGEAGWDRAYPVRAIMTLAPNVALFVTPEHSGVATLGDLVGRRVYLGPSGAGFDFFLRTLLKAHGVEYEDLDAVHGGQTAAVDMLADGSAVAAFLGGAVPTASITQASASQDLLFVPYDPASIERLTGEFLFFNPATIPAGTYRNQEQDFAGLDVGSMHLIAGADADDELVYRLTRTIYEHRDDVVARHAAGRAINPNNVVRSTGTEFHPGAIRFYREIGIWPEDEARTE